MPARTHQRHELLAIASLMAGIFVLLMLLPLDITGPAGRVLGGFLWRYLGVGAAILPVLGVAVGLAGFGRLGPLDIGRVAVLFTGLLVLVPFAIALVAGVRHATDFPATYESWSLPLKLVGIVPGLMAVGVTSVIGTAGAAIVGLVGLSALTLHTIDWHPFRRLTAAGERENGRTGGGLASDPVAGQATDEGWSAIDDESAHPAVLRSSRFRVKKRRSGAKGAPATLEHLPPLDLLKDPDRRQSDGGEAEIEHLGQVLIDTLNTFRVEGQIVGRTTGPVVTQYEVAPAPGVKVGRIASLADDLALAMRAQSIRIVAPIPGKAAVGVEIPNPVARIVTLKELLSTPEWDRARGALPVALGRNLEGRPVIADLGKMPHLLIAGATGTGKSVCINSIITSLIYRYTPRDLRLIMIDPKMVELSMYNVLPHLRHPVVTKNNEAAQAFKWVMYEMERRYELFHANGARNVNDFNRKVAEGRELVSTGHRALGAGGDHSVQRPASSEQRELSIQYDEGPLPFIVVIVDELADLIMTVQSEVEKPLAILAQKARATGIHLVLATQRPSVNVITGLIKANFPCRIAFRVASKVDSRTILDQNGAETLLGNGDMLFLPPGKSEPIRVQGAYLGTEETEAITTWYNARRAEMEEKGLVVTVPGEEDILAVVQSMEEEEASGAGERVGSREWDPLFREAAEVCIRNQQGSTSLLQRKLRIGYGRAARIIDQLNEAGILGPPDGSKPREVLIDMAQLDEYSG
jgi:S-DNA-T family DNA segregation ATPase FtsK/SpoIIIE